MRNDHPPIIDQEFVVHLFAFPTAPDPAAAWERIGAMWSACRNRLGMSQPIPGTGLPDLLPVDPGQLTADGAVAAQEDIRGDRQCVLRRTAGVVNLSAVLAQPLLLDGGPRRRRHLLGQPPGRQEVGWEVFDQMWSAVAGEPTDALLGEVRLYLARLPGRRTGRIDADPALGQQAARRLGPIHQTPGWWRTGATMADGYAVWETSRAEEARHRRRFVVLAAEEAERDVSAWLWSDGGVETPPMARYLLNAAKIRYQVGVWQAAPRPQSHTASTDAAAAQLRTLTAAASASKEDLAVAERHIAALRDQEAEILTAHRDLQLIRHNVQTASRNIAIVLGPNLPPPGGLDPFNDDRSLAAWFTEQLDDDIRSLEVTGEAISRLRRIASEAVDRLRSTPTSAPANPEEPPVPRAAARHDLVTATGTAGRTQRTSPPRSEVTMRLGWTIDAVGYSDRTAPGQNNLQQRLAAFVPRVLEHVGIAFEEEFTARAGDGVHVFLPTDIDVTRVLPQLLRTADAELVRDNQHHRDRLRLRTALELGTFSHGANGFAGDLVVTISRLVDSPALREAVRAHPGADLVALVSDFLYTTVIERGYPGLEPGDFQRVHAAVKTFQATAWLWIPRRQRARR